MTQPRKPDPDPKRSSAAHTRRRANPIRTRSAHPQLTPAAAQIRSGPAAHTRAYPPPRTKTLSAMAAEGESPNLIIDDETQGYGGQPTWDEEEGQALVPDDSYDAGAAAAAAAASPLCDVHVIITDIDGANTDQMKAHLENIDVALSDLMFIREALIDGLRGMVDGELAEEQAVREAKQRADEARTASLRAAADLISTHTAKRRRTGEGAQ